MCVLTIREMCHKNNFSFFASVHSAPVAWTHGHIKAMLSQGFTLLYCLPFFELPFGFNFLAIVIVLYSYYSYFTPWLLCKTTLSQVSHATSLLPYLPWNTAGAKFHNFGCWHFVAKDRLMSWWSRWSRILSFCGYEDSKQKRRWCI